MKKAYDITGLWCGTCAKAVERSLKIFPGVRGASVDYSSSSVFVEWDEGNLEESHILERVEKLGYQLFPAQDIAGLLERKERESRLALMRTVSGLFFSMWATLAVIPIYLGSVTDAVLQHRLEVFSAFFAIPVIVYVGLPFYRAAWKSLRVRSYSLDILVTVSALAAIGLSVYRLLNHVSDVYFDTLSMSLSLLTLARLIEFRARTAAALASSTLKGSGASVSRVVDSDGIEHQKEIRKISEGKTVRLSRGETVLLDGIVTKGDAWVDQSLHTGESLPVRVSVGDRVEAPSVICEGEIDFKVDHVFGMRQLDRVASEARMTMAKAQTSSGEKGFAQAWLRWQIPLSLSLGVLTFVLSMVMNGQWLISLERVVTVLLVSCPCLLTLASPLVRALARQNLGRLDVEVRDLSSLEWFGRCQVFAFDKTGTLTSGKALSVNFNKTLYTPSYIWGLLASAELEARHPIAQLIRTEAIMLGVDIDTTGSRVENLGVGVTWTRTDRTNVVVASPGAMKKQGLAFNPEWDQASALLVIDGSCLAAVFMQESVKADFGDFIKLLGKYHSPPHWVIYSGDRLENVDALRSSFKNVSPREALGLCTPELKAERIRALKSKGYTVSFLGDGLNDILAFAESDLSLSIKHGSSPAEGSASILLPEKDSFRAMGAVYRLSVAVAKVTKQNRLWALSYNLITIPAAMGGFFGPSLAILTMSLSTAFLFTNSLRVTRMG